jgi:primosomal replication protein N
MSSSSTWYPVGIPLLYPSFKLKMVNTSNRLLTVSIDGINPVDVAPANSFWLYDESQAQMATANMPVIPSGTQIYVMSSSAGIGLVFLVSQFLVQI